MKKAIFAAIAIATTVSSVASADVLGVSQSVSNVYEINTGVVSDISNTVDRVYAEELNHINNLFPTRRTDAYKVAYAAVEAIDYVINADIQGWYEDNGAITAAQEASVDLTLNFFKSHADLEYANQQQIQRDIRAGQLQAVRDAASGLYDGYCPRFITGLGGSC